MPKYLTVILGAGASHSLNPERGALDRQEYRPPLTAGIFAYSPEFRQLLQSYPLAEILTSEIEAQINPTRPNPGLEVVLQHYAQALADGHDTHITRQFLQLPLYLNDLFGEISFRFTNSPREYNILVNRTIEHTASVMYLTLNYDTLLEIPLGRISNVRFDSEADYIADPRWLLVKLHGSTHWYRKFITNMRVGSEPEFINLLRQIALPPSLEETVTMHPLPGHRNCAWNGGAYYPALTVPVDGKYEINCPDSHVARAREFLAQCPNYLIIGTSGRDDDLLDMLKAARPGGGQMRVVGRAHEHTVETYERFKLALNPHSQREADVFWDDRGFSEFIDSGKLTEFLQSLH
jgi:hypothetical protein